MAEITAYCVQTKKKNVPMKNAKVSKTSRGGYMAKGDDGSGNKMCAMMSEVNALAAIKSGHAKKDF